MKITKKRLKRLLEEAVLKESSMRYAGIYLASDGQWYLDLASREYGEHDDATTYGPFSSEHSAERHLNNFSNPGGLEIDRDGKAPPPSQSPNGLPVESPRGRRRSMWETRSQLKRIIKENHPDYGEYDADADAWYEERHQADQDYRVHEVPDEVYTRVQNIKDPNRQDHLFDIVDAYEAGDKDFGMNVLLKNLEDAERMDETKMKITGSQLRKIIKESLVLREAHQTIISNEYEDVEIYNVLANYALNNDIQGALADPEIKPYVEKNEVGWISDEAGGWFEHVGQKGYEDEMPAPEGWDRDAAYEFLRDLENAAWRVYDKQATAAIAGDPDKEFLEFLGNQWSSMIEPNDMEGIKWKEYKKYIRLKPPPSISHGVGEIHITKEDTDNLYSGAWEDFKDFLATRAGGQLGKRKARKRSPAPYYDQDLK